MIRRLIRLEYEFTTGKENISFETKACTNEGCTSQIENMLSLLELTRNKITKIELLEIFE